mgnify:CR=1
MVGWPSGQAVPMNRDKTADGGSKLDKRKNVAYVAGNDSWRLNFSKTTNQPEVDKRRVLIIM